MVMFDLPVVEERDRKAANKFRKYLEDLGFQMCQFSVYARFIGQRERTESIQRDIEMHIPENGKVSIVVFTDKQFGEIAHFYNRKRRKEKTNPDQLVLFEGENG